MATTKQKGDLAELKVATDLLSRGYRIAIPYGEDCSFDLVLVREDETLERVQVKHAQSGGDVIPVRCTSNSLTNGKVKRIKRYTAKSVDWIAVYDASTDRCYYVPADELGGGRSEISLRLTPTLNNQRIGVRQAADYLSPERRPVNLAQLTIG